MNENLTATSRCRIGDKVCERYIYCLRILVPREVNLELRDVLTTMEQILIVIT